MLMVIFGAGASYDSCSSFPPDQYPRNVLWHRPPLAKELFINQSQFREVSKLYDRVQPLLPYLEGEQDIEETLEGIRAEADREKERQRQLLAVRYYLRRIIEKTEADWVNHNHGVSNYKLLCDQVRRSDRVCFVTFNYDTLMERALRALDSPLQAMRDYISHRKFSLIKLHGSVDWVQWVPRPNLDILPESSPDAKAIIRAAPVIPDDSVIDRAGSKEASSSWLLLPALAIPTVSKKSFVCPPEHLRALEDFIPSVTKIVVIGWRAGEQHFLKLLKDGLRQRVQVIGACGTSKDTIETYNRLKAAGIDFDPKTACDGFTDFVVKRRIEPFLSEAETKAAPQGD